MKLKIDRKANAAYLYINENVECYFTDCVNNNFIIDYDIQGDIIGIEFLNAQFVFPNDEVELTVEITK